MSLQRNWQLMRANHMLVHIGTCTTITNKGNPVEAEENKGSWKNLIWTIHLTRKRYFLLPFLLSCCRKYIWWESVSERVWRETKKLYRKLKHQEMALSTSIVGFSCGEETSFVCFCQVTPMLWEVEPSFYTLPWFLVADDLRKRHTKWWLWIIH